MKKIYFTPGPSQVYPTFYKHVRKALNEDIASISHRSDQFMEIFGQTRKNLSKLLGIPKTHKIFFLTSATECMERIIENCVDKYTLHFVNGAFSYLFYKQAINLSKKASIIEVDKGSSFDFQNVNVPKNTELICFTHNETSTGASLDLEEINEKFIMHNNSLMALDIVSSAPYIDVDFSLFDLVFFSVQKGFGLPAGLGIVIVSPKAFAKAMFLNYMNKSLRSYHDFQNLDKYSLHNQTPETPNVFLIFLFNKIVRDMIDYGIEKIRHETDIKAGLIYEYFERSKYLRSFVRNANYKSKTVCVADTLGNSGLVVSELKKFGLIVGSGYKEMRANQIRIANFPTHDIKSIKRLIRSFELVCN